MKKGLSVGVSLGMVFFLIFLVDAAAFWSVAAHIHEECVCIA